MNKIITFFVILAVFVAPVFSLFTKEAEAAVTADLYPSGEGSYLFWIPKTGTTHYTMVDESSCNGTTDFIKTSTVGNRDSFDLNLASIPNGSTITNINIVPCASRNSATAGGGSNLKLFYRLDGVDSSYFGSYTLTGTTPVVLSATDISGLSIVKTSTTDLEVGAIYSLGNRGARISNLKTVITYTPAPTVITNAANIGITGTSISLSGTANPNGLSSTGWFRYSTVNPGTCNDTFGTRYPATGGTNLGSGFSNVNFFGSVNIPPLSYETTYYYCAIASNVGGVGFGGVVSFTTKIAPPNPLSITNIVLPTQNDLTWSDNSSIETGYKVYRRIVGGVATFSLIATLPADSESYSDTTATPDQTYYYYVSTYNATDFADSNIAYIVVDTVPPNAPLELSVTPTSSVSVYVTWSDNSSNEEGFVVERSTDGVSYSDVYSEAFFHYLSPTISTSLYMGPTTGTTYYFRVRAYNDSGSSYSPVVTIVW